MNCSQFGSQSPFYATMTSYSSIVLVDNDILLETAWLTQLHLTLDYKLQKDKNYICLVQHPQF